MPEQIKPALPAPLDRPAEVRKYTVASKVLFASASALFQMSAVGGRNGLILTGLAVACIIPSYVAMVRETTILRKMSTGLGRPVGGFTTNTIPMLCSMVGGLLAGSTAYAMKVHPDGGFPIGFVYAGALGLLAVLQTRKLFQQVDQADRQLKLKEAQQGPPRGIAA